MTNQEQYELICEKAEEYNRLTQIKNKLEQLDHKKKFIEIINTGAGAIPYYEIKYLDTVTNKTHIGYSSYSLEVISEYLRNEFFGIIEVIPSAEPRWISVSERLPEKSGFYLVSTTDCITIMEFSNGWISQNIGSCNWYVIAWMPLPEPYKTESEE